MKQRKLILFITVIAIFSLVLVGCAPEAPKVPNPDEQPGTETPGTETPGTETPGTETPGTETPGTTTPGTTTPGTTTPGTTTPGTTTPGTTTPGTTTPGTTTPAKPAREVYDWSKNPNAAILIQMVVANADKSFAQGNITELEADWLLYKAIVESAWPRGSSPSFADIIFAPKTFGYNVPADWNGPIILKAPRP